MFWKVFFLEEDILFKYVLVRCANLRGHPKTKLTKGSSKVVLQRSREIGIGQAKTSKILNLFSHRVLRFFHPQTSKTTLKYQGEDEVAILIVNVKCWPHLHLKIWGFSRFILKKPRYLKPQLSSKSDPQSQNCCPHPHLKLWGFFEDPQ